MKHLLTILALLFSFSAIAQRIEPVNGHMLLTFKPAVKHAQPQRGEISFGITALDMLHNNYHCEKIQTIKNSTGGYGGVYLLRFPAGTDIASVMASYEATGLFSSVSHDYAASLTGAAPNDSLFYKQWALNNDGSFNNGKAKAGADIDMLRAWEIEDGDSSVIVGIIDAGLKLDHPEFEGRIWKNTRDTPGNNLDDDNNGYIDDTVGWNFVSDSLNVTDDNGHGTFVTGILAANMNNHTGYAGIDQHCRLMICKAGDSLGIVYYSWLIGAIYYAVDNGAHVINISAGGYMPLKELEDAVNYTHNHNVLVVAGSGNAGTSAKMYPAGYENAMAIGATGPMDTVAAFSNYGSHISVVAPGQDIYGLSYKNDTASDIVSYGTSFSTPMVTGIASLLLAQNKNRTPEQLRHLVETNAEDMVGGSRDEPGWDKYYGYGRVNAYRTLINEALNIPAGAKDNSISIFPVPAKDVVYIKTEKMKGSTVTITSVTGAALYNNIMQQELHAVNVDSYAAGAYFITLQKDGVTTSVKFIKE